jgi:hypothetical protein
MMAMVLVTAGVLAPAAGAEQAKATMAAAAAHATSALVAKYGAGERARIERGVAQLAQLWRPADGSPGDFEAFAVDNFAPQGAALDGVLVRFREALEQLDGHFLEIDRALSERVVLDRGPITPLDERFGSFASGAHLDDDLFAAKIAFSAVENFPNTTLAERLAGEAWTRRQWAEARLGQRFAERVPAEVRQKITAASAAAELYIAQYNIWMHHLIVDGQRPFPRGLKLISHWNLRDELKANYAAKEGGLVRQRLIAKVMERIVDQTIPRAVIDNPGVDWNPFTNQVTPAPAAEVEDGAKAHAEAHPGEREPDTRYAMFLDTYHAERLADPYTPATPSLIARRFDHDREIPEQRFVDTLKGVLSSPLIPRLAQLIQQRLGRPLEPFDLYYDGFRPRARYPEAELDAITRKRYPTPAAYHADIPRLLTALGFTPARARYFASHIVVDPARGAGHALQSARKGDDPHLRTRVGPGGMDYKGYNIAVHEMGHNIEQICSLYLVDDWFLKGIPNTAFTEALAFVFQARDLELLGLARPDAAADRLKTLSELWTTYEIGGAALVDLGAWHWMYAHPKATPAELRAAVVDLSRSVWNQYYAPVFGARDATLLGIYSHMISSFMYLPDYPLGHLIAAQIEEHMRKSGALGAEFERMASFGEVTPDLWMKHATGEPVSAAALLRMSEAALGPMPGKE